jgi:hypothetical protein
MTTAPTEAKAETKRTAKDEVRALLDRLPDDVTLEKIQYHLDVMVKVLNAEAAVDRGDFITQEEFDQRLAKWLAR